MTTNDKTNHKMNKHFPLLLTMLVLSLISIKAYSQTATQTKPSVAAPPDNKMLGGTSVAAGLSGISSPDLFNGSMNINVPIYGYAQSAFGVSLNYNTHGVRVDEFAGPAGLHWTLSCGGGIVRVMRDLPDEMLATTDSLLAANLPGDVFHTYGPRIYIPNKEMHVYGKLFAYSKSPAQLNAGNAYADHECDEFIVSLPGLSFKFYIGKNLSVFTSSTQSIKVQLLADNSPITNISQFNPETQTLNFKITDNKGNQYYFQNYISDNFNCIDKFWDWAHLYTEDFPPYVNVNYPTNWRLKKVLLANGQSIGYQYSATSLNHGVPYFTDKAYINHYVSESLYNGAISLFYYGVSGGDPEADYFPLLEIDYPNNVQVHFQYSTEKWNAKGNYFLDEIKVTSDDNCNRFRFYENQDTVNKRYFLDSIVQVSCDGSQTEPYYSFTYNPLIETKDTRFTGLLYPSTLPRRLNSGQDLYGFYNGDSVGAGASATHQNIGADVTIPRHHPDIGGNANYGNERDYVAKFAEAGLLTSVRNAYGGEEYFYYGPNVISSVPLADSVPTDNSFFGADQPDGVRVDSIMRTDPSLPNKKQLTVIGYSGGQIFMPGGYFHYPDYIDSATNAWKETIYQSMFLTAHQLVNGANHGYSTVDVKNYADGNLLSRSVMTYTNMQDATSGNQPRYYKVPGSMDYFRYPYTNKQYLKDWEIGLPLTVTDYDQNNRIVKKATNQYTFSQPDLSAASVIANANIVKVNSGTRDDVSSKGFDDVFYPNKKTFTDNYYPFKGIATLARTLTQRYISDTRFITDTVWYVYDNHHNLKNTVTQDSKGDKTATELVYNYDVDGPQYSSPGQQGYTAHPGTTLYNMSADGLEIPVSTERWELQPGTKITDPYGGTVLQSNNLLQNSFVSGYQYQNGKLWTKALWNTQIGNPLGYTAYTGLNPGVLGNPYGKVLAAYNTSASIDDFIKTSQVSLFDVKGNPLETQLQDQDQYKAMIWDTATGQKLAEAANCRYSDIANTSFENSLPEGNLTGSKANIIASSGAITGGHIGLLWTQTSPGTAVSFTGTQNLKAGKQYILSFWVYGAIPAIYAGSQVIPISSANLLYTKGSWHNYQVRFTPSAAGKIKITGTAALSQIDEIRLFPTNAQMQSRTYEPLFGKSSETDPSGRIIYFKYDKMGRQNLVLDMDGNVLSKTDYHVAQ